MPDPLTLDQLQARLAGLPPDAPLTFAAPRGATQGAWHITRISFARLSHLDCDGGAASGVETRIEVMDVGAGDPMTVARGLSILGKGRAVADDAGTAPLRVLFGPGGAGLSVHTATGVDGDGAVRLTPLSARCRPAEARRCC